MAISETMKLALPFVSSLFFLVEAHGQSLPANPVNEPNNKEMRYSELQQEPKIRPPQSIPATRPQPRPSVTAVRDPHCHGNGETAIMCGLVNQYREKHGLKPVQLDDAVSREAQYWSDQLDLQNACWFLYHDHNYHARMRARFPGRRFRENAACSGSTGAGAEFILQKWIDSTGHRQNMLTPEWTKIGVGVKKNIWVIDFTN